MKRRYRMRRYRRTTVRGTVFKLLTAAVLCVIVVLLVDARLRPQIRAVCLTRAVALAQSAVNGAVTQVFSGNNELCKELVSVEQNSEGQVTSIKTDVLKVNLLKASICTAAEAKISEFCRYNISIPALSLTGLDTLAGVGPMINVKVTLTGSVTCGITNDFLSAGINQTLHRMMLAVNADVYVMFPRNSERTNVSTSFCIAETVIVGYVPDFYADTG